MENMKRKAYVKPEAEIIVIEMEENIAFSGTGPPSYSGPFDGEEDCFG